VTRASAPVRIKAGVLTGVTIACALSVYASVLYLLKGAEAQARTGLPLWALITCYLVGGASGGLIFGSLAPFARRQPGASIVGFVSVSPTTIILTLSIVDRRDWFPAGLIIGLLGGLFFGAGIAAVVASASRSRS